MAQTKNTAQRREWYSAASCFMFWLTVTCALVNVPFLIWMAGIGHYSTAVFNAVAIMVAASSAAFQFTVGRRTVR